MIKAEIWKVVKKEIAIILIAIGVVWFFEMGLLK